jgi:hypothetical protein
MLRTVLTRRCSIPVIEISLIDTAFRSGKPGFERVKRLLRNWPKETELFEQLQSEGTSQQGKTFDLLMSYVDDEGLSYHERLLLSN